jgi:hypothetical protein
MWGTAITNLALHALTTAAGKINRGNWELAKEFLAKEMKVLRFLVESWVFL